jgi:hypothetical protein
MQGIIEGPRPGILHAPRVVFGLILKEAIVIRRVREQVAGQNIYTSQAVVFL